MYHIATHNIGLGSYNDDFNHLMKDHFVKGFYTQLGKTIVFNVKRDSSYFKSLHLPILTTQQTIKLSEISKASTQH